MNIATIQPTLLYYAVAVPAIAILEGVAGSGPCTIGLGMALLILLIPVTGFLLLKNLVMGIRKDKAHCVSAAIHATAIGLVVADVF